MDDRVSPEVRPPTDAAVFPSACLMGKFQLRNPFRVQAITWHCRQHLLVHKRGPGSTLRELLGRWFQRKIYRATLSSSSLPKGTASLLVDSAWRDFSFNTANTQFESIYAPEFRHGYEPETAVLFDALLPSDGVMFDIGANWGHVSLFAASRPGFQGHIHAFEPMPPTYADLVASVHGTAMESVVTTHNLALADQEGTAQMSLPDLEQSGIASLSADGGTAVQVTRLDLLNLPAPSLIKIDVEGHESDVLRGASKTIEKSRPMIVFESSLGSNVPVVLEPFQILKELGYVFFLPAFIRDEGDLKRYASYGRNSDVSGTVQLALVPFKPEGRWLLQSHANIFSCHAERLTEVAAAFCRPVG